MSDYKGYIKAYRAKVSDPPGDVVEYPEVLSWYLHDVKDEQGNGPGIYVHAKKNSDEDFPYIAFHMDETFLLDALYRLRKRANDT